MAAELGRIIGAIDDVVIGLLGFSCSQLSNLSNSALHFHFLAHLFKKLGLQAGMLEAARQLSI